MTDMMAEIAAFDGRTAKIVGPRAPAKPRRCCAGRCRRGRRVRPEGILIETSTAEAARVARRRLVDALAAAGVSGRGRHRRPHHRGLRPEGVPCRAETPEARAATGRTPRVLAPFEVQLLPGGRRGGLRPPLALRSATSRMVPSPPGRPRGRRLRSEHLATSPAPVPRTPPEDDWAVCGPT